MVDSRPSNPRAFLTELLRNALDPRMSNGCLGIHVRSGLEQLRAFIRQEYNNAQQRDAAYRALEKIVARYDGFTSAKEMMKWAREALNTLPEGPIETPPTIVGWMVGEPTGAPAMYNLHEYDRALNAAGKSNWPITPLTIYG